MIVDKYLSKYPGLNEWNIITSSWQYDAYICHKTQDKNSMHRVLVITKKVLLFR